MSTSISMYQASVPVCVRALNNLSAVLEKGAEYAAAKNIAPEVLIDARLAADMFPLSRQVQIATDMAKGAAARLAGIDPPQYEDNESTFPELKERIQKTIAYLQSFAPEQIDNSEDKTINLRLRGDTVSFQGLTYLLYFVLPNLFFHVTTAYNILRHNGVEIGKQDFLGKP